MKDCRCSFQIQDWTIEIDKGIRKEIYSIVGIYLIKTLFIKLSSVIYKNKLHLITISKSKMLNINSKSYNNIKGFIKKAGYSPC